MKRALLLAIACTILAGCNANSSKNQYKLAEQLFLEKKYDASIHEFDKIIQRDPLSEYGLKALRQIATIQQIYLDNPEDALKSYKLLLKRSNDKGTTREVEALIATLYFERFEDYTHAIEYFKMLLESDPHDPEADYFMYRLARSYYLQSKFDRAIETFTDLKNRFPSSSYAEKADLEIANSLNSQGKCKEAIKHYEGVVKEENKDLKTMALFEMANCYEALDDLDKAYDLLEGIQETYPNPGVIQLKMQKIKRRKILRRR